MRERPTPEQIADWRDRDASIDWTQSHVVCGPGDAVRHHLLTEIDALLAALDDEKVRAWAAEAERDALRRDIEEMHGQAEAVGAEVQALYVRVHAAERALAAINEPYSGGAAKHTEALYEDQRQSRVREHESLERAVAAEDALARLREVAASVERRIVYSDTSRCWYLAADPGQPALGALREALAATPDDLAEASRREWKARGMEMAADMADASTVNGDVDCSIAERIREAAAEICAKR